MAFQPCPGIAQLTATYSAPDGQLAQNILHVNNTGSWDVTKLTALCAAYVSWESTTTGGVKPADMRHASVSLVNVTARDLTTETSPEVSYSTGLPIAGTVSGQTLPNGVSVSVKLGTGVPGRSFRGRVFFIGLYAAATVTGDSNIIASAYGAKLITIYQNLIAAVKAANAAFDLCVLSRSHNSADRANGIGTNVNAVSLVDGYTDYQRRRAPAHNRGG